MTKDDEIENSADAEEVAEAAEPTNDPDPIVVYDDVQVHRQRVNKMSVPMCEFKTKFPPKPGDTIVVRMRGGNRRYEGVVLEAVTIGDTVCVTFEEGLNPA